LKRSAMRMTPRGGKIQPPDLPGLGNPKPAPPNCHGLVERRGGVPLWFVRRRQRVGYGYAQTRSDDLPAAPETVTLGPIGAREAADVAACVAAAARWASGRAAAVRVSVPGPHPSLGPLLAHGLQIHDLDLFCSTPGWRFVDVRCYLPSGGDLF
jgi:hypothetical protein